MQSVRSGRRVDFVRWYVMLALVAVAIYPQRGFAARKVVTDADKGGDVQMKVGDVLEVRLNSNPSTGYMWYVHPKSTTLLRLNGQTQTEATEPGVGRPIVQVFTFEAKRRGDGILLLRYVRSWEKPALGEEQFNLHVVIE
jgi:predicted secreted protein